LKRKTKKMPQKKLKIEYVFFIKCENYIKIARSVHPRWMLRDMEYSNPFGLSILSQICGNHHIERELKRKFSGYRHKGSWYRYEGKLKEFIEEKNDAS